MKQINKSLINAAQMLESVIDVSGIKGKRNAHYQKSGNLQQWAIKKRSELIELCADPDTRQTLEAWIKEPTDRKNIIPCIAKIIAISAIPENEFTAEQFPIFDDPLRDINAILAPYGNTWKQARDNYKINNECDRVQAGEDIAEVQAVAANPTAANTTTAAANQGGQSAAAELLQKLIDIKPELNKDRYPWVDIGFSRLFSDIYVNNCRYNSTAKCWYFYDGKRWVKDQDGKRVEALAKDFYHGLVSYCASQYIDQNIQQPYLNEVCKLGKFNPRATVIKDAASDNFFVYEDLDKDPDLFNCQNGVFNLKTMTFTPGHSPDQLLSKISNVVYDPNADSKEWEKFINEVMQGDAEKIEYLQKVLGYSLTTNTDEECLWFWYGEKSRNGKSTTAETYSYMMGNAEGYAAAVDPNTLAQKQNNDSSRPNGDIACLEGVRFLNVSEPPKNMIFNAALVKKLTGGNRIKARDNYEKFHEYNPIFKIIIDTNYLPIVLDDTLFLSGRVIVVTFDRVFSEAEQDHTLKDRLRTPQNISGLFNWCLEGLEKYRRDGLKKPQSIQEATELYQNNSDKVNMFITECMDRTQGINTKGKDVYQRYKQWCFDCGYSPEGQQNFFGTLRKKNLLGTGTVAGATYYNVMLDYTIKP